MVRTTQSPAAPNQWAAIAPELDAVLSALRVPDRRVVVLRYLEGRSIKEVAAITKTTTSAAKQRLHRAIGRMRAMLRARDIEVAAPSLAAVALAHALQPAPPAMAASVRASALAGPPWSGAAAALMEGALSAMAWTQKTRLIAAAAAFFLILGCAVVAGQAMRSPAAQNSRTAPATQATPATKRVREEPPADRAAREAIVARLQILQRIEVEYDVAHKFGPKDVLAGPASRPAPQPTPLRTVLKTGTERSSRRFAFLNGRARWEVSTSEETRAQDMERRTVPVLASIRTYGDGILQGMDVRADKPLGGIDPCRLPPLGCFISLVLGVHDRYANGWMTADALNAMELTRDEDGRIILHRLDGKGRLEWVFDSANGHAMIAHRRYAHLPPHGLVEEATASDFRPVDGFSLPFTLMHRDIYTNGEESNRWEATVTKYVLNGPDNTPEHYHVPWRKGMTVLDRRTGQRHEIVANGQPLVKQIGPVTTPALVP